MSDNRTVTYRNPMHLKSPGARQRSLQRAIFFGTGTSGCVPSVACLTDPNNQCKVCKSAANDPESKNRRLNTSIMLVCKDPSAADTAESQYNILIDCGKTFYNQAITWCPKYRLRRLDAVILSHGHADATLGLDDLRAWTLGQNSIQSHVDVYLTSETFETVQQVFPYLVDRSKASGGGDVAGLRFHIIQPDPQQPGGVYLPIRLGKGVEIRPFDVEHGKTGNGETYFSLGFRVDDFTYISDASRIPENSRQLVAGTQTLAIDALHEKPHPSHFSIDETVEEIRQFKPRYAFLTGFTHRVDHEETQNRLANQADGTELYLAWDGLELIFSDRDD